MNRGYCLMLLLLSVLPVQAADWTSKDLDTLLYHAQRYGDTVERRENKARAREALFARGADSLRFLMEQMHIENLWIRLLAQELTFQLDADEAIAVLAAFIDAEHQTTRRVAIFLKRKTYRSGYALASRHAQHQPLPLTTVLLTKRWQPACLVIQVLSL